MEISGNGANLNPWPSASQWIQSNGGFVHDALTFHVPDRTVRVILPISPGTLLLRIPSQCLITLPSVERDEKQLKQQTIKRPSLFSIVHALDQNEIYHEKDDLLLALFLATQYQQHRQQSSNANEIYLEPYLTTLPPHSDFDNLPRRWPADQLETLLTGTSLFHRVNDQKRGLIDDYTLIVKSWRRHVNKTDSTGQIGDSFIFSDPPPFNVFDHMIAAVASRAFSGLGGSSITNNKDAGDDEHGFDAMIPLLDLFNHKRGAHETSDVRYVRSEENGSILVTTSRKLEIGSLPSITYGAKGNAQLLLRYGFCLHSNTEPDGSANDVLEFRPKPDHPIVELRIGPKSYTFGSLVKALELFHDSSSRQIPSLNNKNDDTDMEAYLHSCEVEDTTDFNLYGEDEEDNHLYEDDMVLDDTTPEVECRILGDFVSALQKLESKYSLCEKELEDSLQNRESLSRHYSALLVHSELQTIYFYTAAARSIIQRLQKLEDPKDGGKEGESMLIRPLVDDLVTTFMQIRYPHM